MDAVATLEFQTAVNRNAKLKLVVDGEDKQFIEQTEIEKSRFGPYEQQLMTEDEFLEKQNSGELAYIRKCRDLRIVPCQKLIRAIQNNVTQLNLKHYGIGKSGCVAMCEALKSYKSLNELVLGDNGIADMGSEALSLALQSPQCFINNLHLSANLISGIGCVHLSRAIGHEDSRLVELDLSKNQIDDTGAEALMHALKNNTTLEKLNLSQNNIETKGARYLAEMLESNYTIQYLDLSWNHLLSGGVFLAEAIKNHRELMHVAVAWAGMGSASGKAFADCIANCKLEAINLAHNRFDGECVPELVEALAKSNLDYLNLSHNPFGPENVESVKKALKECKIKTTKLEGMEIYETQLQYQKFEQLEDEKLNLELAASGAGVIPQEGEKDEAADKALEAELLMI